MTVFDRSRWERVDEIFTKALDLPVSQRDGWVSRACGGDRQLEDEVHRLLELAQEDEPGDVLRVSPAAGMQGPLWDEWAKESAIDSSKPAFQVGDELGQYRIEGLLGRGGMGEVYVAEDPKLGRRVAVKTLPSDLDSEERRKRFETEAKAIAALNHPNVVHVYSIEEAQGVHFLTMEWVQGKTVSKIIPPQGLGESRLLEIAVPLVSALHTAHEQGVIHRDVKPANVMINDDGRVKVLDFGLAKLRRDPLPETASGGPQSATIEGHIVGTASHMSPEQAEARPIDHRSDIFSLGVTLYEMATGELPFRGSSLASVLTSILRDTPTPVTSVNPKVSKELGRIIKRCLNKDPARRYQSCRDLQTDLEELQFEMDSQKLFVAATRERAPRLAGWPVLLGVSVFGLLAVLLATLASRPEEMLTPRFDQLTTQPGPEAFPSLSPDGSYVIYASRESGNWDIYMRRLSGQRALNLTEDSEFDDTQPVFAPDGETIAFRSAREGGGLFVMGATGESVRRVSNFGWNPAFSPSGTHVAFATEAISRDPFDRPTNSEIWTVELSTGEQTRVFGGDGVQPSWSPNGKWIAFWGLRRPGAQRDLWTVAADGSAEAAQPVTSDASVDWNPIWANDGASIYFASDRGGSMNLWRVPMDQQVGVATGEPVPITTPSPFISHLSLAADGERLAYVSTIIYERLAEASFSLSQAQVEERSVRRDAENISSPRLSPDGSWIAFSRTGIQEDIVLLQPEGAISTDLTSDQHRDRSPRWSPDGKSVAFYSNRGGSYQVWAIDRDGTNLRVLTDVPDQNLRYPVFSPDGERLLYSYATSPGWILSLDTDRAEELPPFTEPGHTFVPVDWSKDGRTILGYLQSTNGARAGIATLSLEAREYRILTDFGYSPAWFADSRHIVFQSPSDSVSELSHNYQQDSKIFLLDSETGAHRELLAVEGVSLEEPAPSHDGSSIFFVETTVESDIWLVSYEPQS